MNTCQQCQPGFEYYNNKVRDYNQLQGVYHPSDLSHQVIRDVNVRYITIENSSNRPVGIAITTYFSNGQVPPIRFIIEGNEIRHLGINSQGEMAQFIHLIDLESKQPVSQPKILQRNANQFVLRDGINKWWVDTFHRIGYRG